MRFEDKREKFIQMVHGVALMISLGAVFFQIWILILSLDAYFKGQYSNLGPSVILSLFGFGACGISVLLTRLSFIKGIREGRSFSYQKKVN